MPQSHSAAPILACMPPIATALLAVVILACSNTRAATLRPTPGAEILWDRYGVAHVYGKSVNDLFYGFGWAQAHSHGDILARLHAQARGRAAEYYGADELKNDRWMAVNDVPGRASSCNSRQSARLRANLKA